MSLVGSTTSTSLNATTLTGTRPGVAAGNLLVLTVSWTNLTTNTIAAPAGWLTAENPAGQSNGVTRGAAAIFYKENAAAGSHSFSITLDATSAGDAVISEFPAGTLNVHTNNGATTGTSGDTGTTAAAKANDLVVVALCVNTGTGPAADGLTSPASSGYSSLGFWPNESTNCGGEHSYKEGVAAGTQTGSWTWTSNSSFVGSIATFSPQSPGLVRSPQQRQQNRLGLYQQVPRVARPLGQSANADATLSLSDSAAGTETLQLDVTIAGADSGAGTDSAAVVVSEQLADSGAGADAVALAASVAPTDTSSGSESGGTGVAIGASDSAAASDGIVVDTGSPDRTVDLADAALGADQISVQVSGEQPVQPPADGGGIEENFVQAYSRGGAALTDEPPKPRAPRLRAPVVPPKWPERKQAKRLMTEHREIALADKAQGVDIVGVVESRVVVTTTQVFPPPPGLIRSGASLVRSDR